MSKRIRFNVLGTTCASCEVLIERELKKIDGVISVHASHQNACVELQVTKKSDISSANLEQVVGSHGYKFEIWDDERHGRNGSWDLKRMGGVILIVLALWYVLEQFGVLDISPTFNGVSGLWPIFFIGIVASLSSCTAVLAGLILALSANHARRHGDSESTHDRLKPHILFNLGRVLGFAFFGIIVGALGSLLVLSPTFNAVFVLVVAVLMVGIGANLLELVPKGKFQVSPPKWLSHKIHDLQDSHNPTVPFVLGALSFFLPCGFTQSVQLYALTTGNPIMAGAIMAVFAIGTVPALFGLGAATSVTKGKTLKRVTQAAGILVLVLGFAQLQNGMTLLGVSLPDSISEEQLTIAEQALTLVDGKQLVQMEIASAGLYSPDVLQVVEGIPVEWEIYGPEFMGCFDTLVSRGLGINTRLKTGMNVIEFTPEKPGTYVFSCSMGMSRGTMIVLPNEG